MKEFILGFFFQLQAQVNQYNDLKELHTEIVVEYHKVVADHSRCQATQKVFDKEFVDKTSKIKELSISVSQLEKVIEHKNSEIGETLAALDLRQTECQKALKQVIYFSATFIFRCIDLRFRQIRIFLHLVNLPFSQPVAPFTPLLW
jgi:hypothetical protein